MNRVEDLQAYCVCRTTDGSVIAGSSAARAVKSVSWCVSCEMEVTRVEERAYIKIAVLRRRNEMECHSEFVEALGNNNALPYSTVARWVEKFQQGRGSASDEQRSGRPLSVRTDLARSVQRDLARGDRDNKKTDRETHNKRIVMSPLCVLYCQSFAPRRPYCPVY
ncbi:HTH_48 domain-containing protein [Trichonephila clavata]|uniref:HTH_48 domain-containing protein n=1 Tax=Trichonephila clavata TaxID=2740835 RepID=A0A8X6GYA8_TRICU|nr:HTH_48 domain-containing protein [Trichonephila clavata]